MNLPNATTNFTQERAGVLAVAAEINRIGLIWRETPLADVGIDGQIELVNSEGQATGQLVAIQVKSGPSYFHDHDAEWHFYPQDKHRFYWERFPLPVIVMLHSPSEQTTYWVDARQFLRSPHSSTLKYIPIPKENQLQTATHADIFATLGITSDGLLSSEELLHRMILCRTGNASFPLSYFDLFVNGLTNTARSLYFSMDLPMELVETVLTIEKSLTGWGIGHKEYEFLFNYMQFLVQQHIADINFSDCLIDWYEQGLVPSFIAPLTSRGRQLVTDISNLQNTFSSDQKIRFAADIRVAQEGLVNMLFTPSHYARIPVIKEFQNIVLRSLTHDSNHE